MQETRSGPALVWPIVPRPGRPLFGAPVAVILLVVAIGVGAAAAVAVSRGSGAIAVGGAGAFAVGAFLFHRRAAPGVALALAGFGLASVASDLIDGLVLAAGTDTTGLARPVAMASAWIFPLVGAFGNALMLVYPTGFPVGRWRWLLRSVGAAGVGGAVAGFAWALGVPTETLIASAVSTGPAVNPAEYFAAGIFFAFPLSLASLLSRYRRGSVEERLQIRWLLFSFGCVFAVTIGQNIAGDFSSIAAVTSTTVGFLLIPISIGVAILRYRLYDIDRIISRTVAYAMTASVVAVVYAAPVVLIPAMFDASNELVVAGSTLAAASVFNPVRRWAKRLIDRRFSRLGYDPEAEVARVGRLLRDNTNLDGIEEILGGVLGRTLVPAHAAIWVRPENR